MVSSEMLDILACPDCKSALALVETFLLCRNGDCRRRYRIEDDIPVMLIEESEVLSADDWAASPAAAQNA